MATDSSLPLRVAAVAAERNVPIARAALHRLADKTPPPPDPWPPETRQALVRVLATGRPAIDALEALDHDGLLVRLLPEWAAVRNRPQRNAYHRFTVDRHLLEAAANAAALVDRVDRPDLLLVGALLHDIGKGYPGDHTDVGVVLVAGRSPTRMGFAPADVDTLVAMCRLHLLLPDTATRRDLDDPTTIETVAAAVGDRRHPPTCSARSPKPTAWPPDRRPGDRGRPGSWPSSSTESAGSSTAATGPRRPAAAAGGSPTPTGRRWTTSARPDARRSSSTRRRSSSSPRRTVRASWRRWPACSPCTASTSAARTSPARTAWPPRCSPSRSAAARGRTAPGSGRISRPCSPTGWPSPTGSGKARDYANGRRRPPPGRSIRTSSSDNEASATSTVVEIRAVDEVGLLHRVTRTLFDCDLDVVSARVSTVGDAVVDAFYVRDAAGAEGHRPAGARPDRPSD